MQTQAQNVNAIRFGSGVLEIGGVNVGLLKNAKFELVMNMIKISADNGLLPVKKKIENAKMSAELYEINLTNLATLDSHGVLSAVAGASTPITGELLAAASTVPAGSMFRLANISSAGLATAITLKNNGVTITGANYSVGLDSNGKTVITLDGETVVTGTGLTIDYTYVATANKTITWSDVAKLVTYYEVKFYNTDQNGKKFTILIPKGYMSSAIARTFASDEAVDATATMPVEFEAFPDANNVMVQLIDEQAN